MKRPILYLLVPFALGIAFSAFFKVPLIYIFSLGALGLVISIICSKKNLPSHIALYLAIFFFGVFHYQNSIILPSDHISRFASDHQKKVSLQGMISDDPVASLTPYKKMKTVFVLNVDSIKEDESWRVSRGLVDISLYGMLKRPLHFGQKIIVEGIISKPVGLKNPGLFDYTKYLAIKDIYAVFRAREGSSIEIVNDNAANPIKAAAYGLRSWMRVVMDKYLKAPYSGFIKAIMIGDRTDLRYNLNNDFVKTGTVHAIAISGLNVGLISAMFLGVLALLRLPKKLNLILVACIMILYTFIAGSSPPIVRAVIIFIVFVAGYLMNRESEILNSLAFAALIMLVINPRELFDPSFQLSFVSIASMIALTPKINGLLRIDAIGRDSFLGKSSIYLLSATSVSIAAWIGTWPIVARYFNIISPVALLANLVVVPALFLLTAGSFLFLLASLFSGLLAGLLAHGLCMFCGALFTVNHFFGSLPLAYIRIAAPNPVLSGIYYAALALLITSFFGASIGTRSIADAIEKPPEAELKRFRARRALVIISMLFCLNILVWRSAMAMNPDVLRITFLDVGQGDSALVELPGGRNLLIDAGPGGDEERFDAARSVIAPYLWNRNINKLDALVATHFHEDHIGGGIYLLENFQVDRVIDNGASSEGSEIFNRYLSAIKAKKIRRETIGDGDIIRFNGGTIFVLNPVGEKGMADSNENSIVLKVRYKNFTALFCADASGIALERMINKYGNFLKSDIIKVPHHGQDIGGETIAKDFFSSVSAKFAIISIAKNNRYGSSSEKSLKYLRDLCPIIYETKDNGAITVLVNGPSYEIVPYVLRQEHN